MFQNIFQISLSLMAGVFIGWNFHIFYMALEPKNIHKEDINYTTITNIKKNPHIEENKSKKIALIQNPIIIKKIKKITDINKSKSLELTQFKKLLNSGNFNDAMGLYIKADEKKLKEYRLLIKVYFYDNIDKNPQKIIEDILTYIDIEPNSQDIKIYLANIYKKRKEFDKALEILFELNEIQNSKNIEETLNLTIQEYIRYLKDSKSISKLIEFLNTIINRIQNNEIYIVQLAQLYNELNQYQKAKDILEEINEDSIYFKKAQTLINKMESQKYQYIIPLDKIGSHYSINLTINDTPLKLILDTGATYTFINSEKLSSVDIGKEIMLNTAGGTIIANFAKADILRIGELELKDFPITIAPFTQEKSDGLLGMNFFKKFDFKINQTKGILYLNPK